MKPKPRKPIKIILSVFSVAVILIGLFFGVQYGRVRYLESKILPFKESYYELPVNRDICIDYIYDRSDVSQIVQYADLVFVGEVKAITGTEYKYLSVSDTGKIQSSPYTHFMVTVADCIKGELPAYTEKDIIMGGGVSLNKKQIQYMGNEMPVVGEYYLFTVKLSENSELYLDYASAPLDYTVDSENSIVEQFRSAYKK